MWFGCDLPLIAGKINNKSTNPTQLENMKADEPQTIKNITEEKFPTYTLGDLLNDNSPMPEDLISPRLLTPGGMLLIGGAPKVGKSDFLLNLLLHLAAGENFLGFKPPRPLRIFYLQAEVGYHYLRERMHKINIPEEIKVKGGKNMFITGQIQMMLNGKGVQETYDAIAESFPFYPPDIICIDPIRNFFDGGSENDNNDMIFFLKNRIEKLRAMINPDMGMILCHHTRKMRKKDVEEDPFQAFSGAGSLRGFYSSGLIMHRPEENESKIHLHFELRNGSSIPRKIVEKVRNKWIELNPFSESLVKKEYGKKLNAERDRKNDAILNLINSQALVGKIYTMHQFSEVFENKMGLGCTDTIKKRILVLASKGYIRFSRDWLEFGLENVPSKYGLMCIKNMKRKMADGSLKEVTATHFKCQKTGAVLEVSEDLFWPQDKEENDD